MTSWRHWWVGLAVFALLAVRFSPNWLMFCTETTEALAEVSTPVEKAAVKKAVLSGYAERGFLVLAQTENLSTEIADPNHKIIRWRLLVPSLGHFLRLPGWLVLGLAHIGCLMLVITLWWSAGQLIRAGTWQLACFAVIAGATSPFFTSMGWLGYYDAWLAVGLLVVAFSRRGWVGALACALTPWVDERFIIGLPLALVVRRMQAKELTWSEWARREALLPVALATGYAALRLSLGGSGGSQTVAEYLREFVYGARTSAWDRLLGAVAGLRVAWVLAFAAFVVVARRGEAGRFNGAVLGVVAFATVLVAVVTALDTSRSMVLLVPLLPLGWAGIVGAAWWDRGHAGALLAAAALLLPARHVFARLSIPVDDVVTPSLPLRMAENNVGALYVEGGYVRPDARKAVKWFRRAAEHGSGDAQANLGIMYGLGEGVPRDPVEAVNWYRRAAENGSPMAEANLGAAYRDGYGVPRNGSEAVRWFSLAAERGLAVAQSSLAAMYEHGQGVPRDEAGAEKWYRAAAEQGDAEAAFRLAALYDETGAAVADPAEAARWYERAANAGHGPAAMQLASRYLSGRGEPHDLVKAYRWLLMARAAGAANADRMLDSIAAQLTPRQIDEATELATKERRR